MIFNLALVREHHKIQYTKKYQQRKNRPSVTSTETADTSEDAYSFCKEYCIIFGQPSQSEHVFDGCYFYTQNPIIVPAQIKGG